VPPATLDSAHLLEPAAPPPGPPPGPQPAPPLGRRQLLLLHWRRLQRALYSAATCCVQCLGPV